MQSSQPWALAKNPETRGELETVLAAIIRQLARHAIHLSPFMPTKAQELWTQIGGPGRVEDQRFDDGGILDVAGWHVAKGPACSQSLTRRINTARLSAEAESVSFGAEQPREWRVSWWRFVIPWWQRRGRCWRIDGSPVAMASAHEPLDRVLVAAAHGANEVASLPVAMTSFGAITRRSDGGGA